MSNNAGATLVAEIGSVSTRVTLIDTVDGEARLIGQADVPSTTEPPYTNAAIAIFEAAALIGDNTGRRLVEESSLVMPQTNERDGIDAVLAVTSAAGQLSVVIAAVSGDVSARSAQHAAYTTYTSLLQTVTLNDAATQTNATDDSWIERQVQRLLGLDPDVVLLAGGLEDGAADSLVRLAHIVSLTALSPMPESDGQRRVLKVIFAGNSHSRERVIEALAGRVEPIIVDNLRPTLDIELLEPTRRALMQVYNERVLPRLPGLAALRRLCHAPVRTSHEAAGLITRFLAERYGRDVLSLDIGSANTAVALYSQQQYSPVVMGGVGTGYGIGTVLAECGPAAIKRWLPFPITEQELIHQLLNKSLRPQMLPTTREELLLEHAVAREAASLVMAKLQDERNGAPYDMVVVGGGVPAHAPHPGLAALTVLDALQPGMLESGRALDLHLDTLGLMEVCGALAFSNPDAALSLFERDLLRNTPLATCIIALGNGRAGDIAVEAELQIVGGGVIKVSVAHGQIGRLPLPYGRKGQLTLRPASGVRIGNNPPGVAVPTDLAAISGSALGVVIDARGRPLRLPEDDYERQRLLWDWLVALGVENGPLPYGAAVPLPDHAAVPLMPIEHLATEDEAPVAEPVAVPTTEVESDLAKLRQTVEPPVKRGLFGRKR